MLAQAHPIDALHITSNVNLEDWLLHVLGFSALSNHRYAPKGCHTLHCIEQP